MKIWAYLALAVMLIGATGAIYRAGFVSAKAKYQDATLAAVEVALKDAKIQWEANVVIAEAEIIIEERIVEVTREVEKRIPYAVETIKYECRDLGSAWIGLYNDAISSSITPDAEVANSAEPN